MRKNIKKTATHNVQPQTLNVGQLIKEIGRHLSGPSLEIISAQLRLSKRSVHGRRWTTEDKSLALSILHASPQAYKLLSKVFILPSIKTLRTSIKKLKIYPGFNRALLDAFKLKVAAMTE